MTHGLTVIPNITDMGLTGTPGPAHSPLSSPPLGHLLFPHQGAMTEGRRKTSFKL